MFVTNWISTTKIQKISEITNFFRHYFLSRTEVKYLIIKVFVGLGDGSEKKSQYLADRAGYCDFAFCYMCLFENNH